jgi:hypothetical protein
MLALKTSKYESVVFSSWFLLCVMYLSSSRDFRALIQESFCPLCREVVQLQCLPFKAL